jgi:TPR repeat protein
LPLLEGLASSGDARAQYRLGMMYGLGQGVTRDDSKARHWLRSSANQGNPAAMYELANLYFAGHGGAQDLDGAVYLYGLAAELGSRPAQLKLAELFASGNAVARDEERAYIYLLIANPEPGSDAATLRATLETRLTERQQVRARKFAERWLARQRGSDS